MAKRRRRRRVRRDIDGSAIPKRQPLSPTPAEIAERCREIRAQWDDKTEFQRRVNQCRYEVVLTLYHIYFPEESHD